jgi:hypothetical protein
MVRIHSSPRKKTTECNEMSKPSLKELGVAHVVFVSSSLIVSPSLLPLDCHGFAAQAVDDHWLPCVVLPEPMASRAHVVARPSGL